MLATMMSANVAMVIIPGQRKVVAALRAGLTPDPNHGRRGKQRSVHNTYVTLPVIVAMISNHYGPLARAGSLNWLALILLMTAGAVIRLFFVLRHEGPWRWELVPVALLLIAATMWLGAPSPPPPAAAATPATFAAVQSIVDARCVVCHNANLANRGYTSMAPRRSRSTRATSGSRPSC